MYNKLKYLILACCCILSVQAQDYGDYYYLYDDEFEPTVLISSDLVYPSMGLAFSNAKGSNTRLIGWNIGVENKLSDSWGHWFQFDYFQEGTKDPKHLDDPIFMFSSAFKYYTGGDFGEGFYLRSKLLGLTQITDKTQFHLGGGLGLGWDWRLLGNDKIRFFVDFGVKFVFSTNHLSDYIEQNKALTEKPKWWDRAWTFMKDETVYGYQPNRMWDASIGLVFAL